MSPNEASFCTIEAHSTALRAKKAGLDERSGGFDATDRNRGSQCNNADISPSCIRRPAQTLQFISAYKVMY